MSLAGSLTMRIRLTSFILFSLFAVVLTAMAQQPPERSPDRPPRDEGTPRREGRPDDDGPPPPGKGKGRAGFPGDRGDDDGPPPPGKGGPRGKPDSGDKGRSFGGGGFGGGFPGPRGEMPTGPGFGGGRGFGGPMMPGMPGPGFGEGGPPDDPEMRDIMRQDMDMERKTHELAMRVREARGEERTKLKTEITEHVNKHFEVRQKRRELQLKRMEEELQRLRDAISSRNKSRESIVTNHIKELIGEERDLEF